MSTIDYRGSYKGRFARQRFAVMNFYRELAIGTVLDVGGGENRLQRVMSETKVVSVDLYHSPTVKADLNGFCLPFASECFDTVVCLDVLEHIDAIHFAFDELLRVAKSYVLISLPNTARWKQRMHFLLSGKISGKYGLPVRESGDRHHWVVNYREAQAFVHARTKGTAFKVAREFPYFYQFSGLAGPLVSWLMRRIAPVEASAWSYWCLLESRR